jgi:hypothetical protein
MDETTVVVALVLGLLVGSAVGYFGYRAMNIDESAPALEPQPQVRDHNHLGLWLVWIATLILGTVTAKAVFEHVVRG